MINEHEAKILQSRLIQISKTGGTNSKSFHNLSENISRTKQKTYTRRLIANMKQNDQKVDSNMKKQGEQIQNHSGILSENSVENLYQKTYT